MVEIGHTKYNKRIMPAIVWLKDLSITACIYTWPHSRLSDIHSAFLEPLDTADEWPE